MAAKTFNVLFVDAGNSARSIMAEVILNREGLGKFKAFSAGSQPKGEINSHAATLLQKLNFNVKSARPKSWNEFLGDDAPKMDFVFTVDDDMDPPAFPGEPMVAHWGVPDPAKVEGTEAEQALAFAEAYRMLSQRISIFANLPLDGLDHLALHERLTGIGTSK
jgi:arsenate reductase (thioredoxin)